MDINSKVLAVLQSSTCFGIAYDDTVPECKKCDVSAQCKVKSTGFPLDNATTQIMDKALEPARTEKKKKATPSTSTKKKKTTSASTTKSTANQVKITGDVPEFKGMSLEELKKLAETHSVEWRDYGNDNITRMRLIMVLKKCYQ